MAENVSEIEEIAWKISRYLSEHPNAADSLEGIVQWWLPRQQIGFSPEKVKVALDYLLSQQLISRTITPEGKVVYARMKKVPRLH